MKTTTTYKTYKGDITVETRLPVGRSDWHSIDKTWEVAINGEPFQEDSSAGKVCIRGPYPQSVLLEIVEWEKARQPKEATPEVIKDATITWTDIS